MLLATGKPSLLPVNFKMTKRFLSSNVKESSVWKLFGRKIGRYRVLAIVIGLTLVFYYGFSFLSRLIDIDRCLDSGGRYNYEADACVTK